MTSRALLPLLPAALLLFLHLRLSTTSCYFLFVLSFAFFVPVHPTSFSFRLSPPLPSIPLSSLSPSLHGHCKIFCFTICLFSHSASPFVSSHRISLYLSFLPLFLLSHPFTSHYVSLLSAPLSHALAPSSYPSVFPLSPSPPIPLCPSTFSFIFFPLSISSPLFSRSPILLSASPLLNLLSLLLLTLPVACFLHRATCHSAS